MADNKRSRLASKEDRNVPRLQYLSGSAAKESQSIPDLLRWELPGRIQSYAKKHFRGKFTHIDVRFRGALCYIDAYSDPAVRSEELPPIDTRQYRDYLKTHDDKVTHLCRIRYLGSTNQWELDFFAYSSEKYEPSVFLSGRPTGTPEEAFHLAANIYL